MEIFIASNEQADAGRLCAGLGALGMNCSSSHIVPHGSVKEALLARDADSSVVVFFCSQTFSPDEIAALKSVSRLRPGKVMVVAAGPLQSPKVVLQTMRNGAVDFIDINNSDLPNALAALFDRLAAKQPAAARPRNLFTVLGPTGGAGASLLACNMAVALAQQGKQPVLLDLDMRGGDQAKLLNASPRYTLASLADKASQLDAAMFDQSLVEHECGVRLLASPLPFADFRQLPRQVVQTVLECAQAASSHVVVDLGEPGRPDQAVLLAASDRIVVPLRADFISLFHVKQCLNYLTQAKVTPECVTLVVNRAGLPRELPLASIAEALERPIEHWIPDDPAIVNTSLNVGIPLVISHPRSAIAHSIVRLVDDLTDEAPSIDGSSCWLAPLLASARWIGGLLPTGPSISDTGVGQPS